MVDVYVIECTKCGDRIYSRARHDFKWCSCKSIAIDGGFSGYTKVCGNKEDIRDYGLINIPYTKEELYQDWNKGVDRLGKL
jgi:hypothetical protein